MGITASIVVSFTNKNSQSGILTAELDTRADGYNGGKSVFSAGDEPVILVRKSTNLTVQSICSVGSCNSFATGQTAEQEFLSYIQTNKANSSKVISSGFASNWYGNNLGAVKVVGQNEIQLTSAGPYESVAVLGIDYSSQFTAYKLTGIPSSLNGREDFQVLVAFIGTFI